MPQTDEEIDRTISVLLRTGVATAASIVFAGAVWYLARSGGTIPDYRVFHGEPQELRSVSGILGAIAGFHPRAVIQFGVLLLIATPIARVAFSVVAFAKQHDRTYVVITLLVLVILLCSLSGLVTPPR